jgi:hypothetical protein
MFYQLLAYCRKKCDFSYAKCKLLFFFLKPVAWIVGAHLTKRRNFCMGSVAGVMVFPGGFLTFHGFPEIEPF